MPDDKVTTQPEAEATPETKGGSQGEQGAESTTTTTEDQGKTGETKPGAEGSGSEAAKELVLENAVKTEEGFELRVGSSVYKGKTISEVVNSLIKGKADADSYIVQLQSKNVTRVPDKFSDRNLLKGQPKEGAAAVELPDQQVVYQEEIRRALAAAPPGFKAEMLSWSEEQWDAYADSDGVKSYRVSEYRGFTREARQTAKRATDERMDEASAVAINAEIIDTETASVQKLLENSGLSEDAMKGFDYEAVLDRAVKNRGRGGIINSGAIVSEAALEIQKMLKDEHKSPIAKKLIDDIVKGKAKVAAIPATKGGSGAQHSKPTELKPIGDWDKATERAIADFNSGKR